MKHLENIPDSSLLGRENLPSSLHACVRSCVCVCVCVCVCLHQNETCFKDENKPSRLNTIVLCTLVGTYVRGFNILKRKKRKEETFFILILLSRKKTSQRIQNREYFSCHNIRISVNSELVKKLRGDLNARRS